MDPSIESPLFHRSATVLIDSQTDGNIHSNERRRELRFLCIHERSRIKSTGAHSKVGVETPQVNSLGPLSK